MSLLWKIGGGVIALLAVYFLVTLYGGSRYKEGRADEASAWQLKVTEAERGRLTAFQQGLAVRDAASTVFRETIRTLPPITNTIIERTTRYEATPAGAALCLAPDRVQGIDATRSALFPATAASSTPRGP